MTEIHGTLGESLQELAELITKPKNKPGCNAAEPEVCEPDFVTCNFEEE